jgi:hypothetical protein
MTIKIRTIVLYFILGLIIGFFFSWVFWGHTKTAGATTTHREWSSWSNWSGWSSCQVKDERTCGATLEGTKTRTKTRTCQNHSGSGYNECSYVGQVDTYTDRDDCEVKLPDCTPEGQCPTDCGLSSSEVPDGKGGTKVCEATAVCPPAEGVCETQCGKFESYVPDGKGGQKYCPATDICRGSVAAPSDPTCQDLGGYAPTITSVSRVDNDTVRACWTKPSDNADSYLVWYGNSKDNLTYNVTTPDLCVDINGMTGMTWLKVAGKSQGCTGVYSLTIDP